MVLSQFIHETSWDDLPETVRRQARRCLLDTLGAAIGGRQTRLSQVAHDFAASNFGGGQAFLWLDGRPVSPPGAALANGMTIDALDIHDGYTLTKGHAGAAIVPVVLAVASIYDYTKSITGRELLTDLVVGYEVALRAGRALHATATDYHTSGAWNALGCAAVVARSLALTRIQTGHALGIAEYHGPRSPMMRCIDHPTMLKDGSGWGAMAGVSAALLAQSGFSGAPAETVELSGTAAFWADLGTNWLITDQYFKPHAVCRWAQPAITGALTLQQRHCIKPEDIRSIRVYSFHEAVRLAGRRPQTTEEAQYSLPFPLATALIHSRLGPFELSGPGLSDAEVCRLADRVELIEEELFSARFPAERFARVQIETQDGHLFDSGEVEATWGATDPPSDDELLEKFRWLSRTILPDDRAARLEKTLWRCDEVDDVSEIITLLAPPVEVSR